MNVASKFAPRAAFVDSPVHSPAECGIAASVCDGFAIAAVLARRLKEPVLAQRVLEKLGIELPPEPRRRTKNGVAILGVGPGAWLVMAERGGNAFSQSLVERFGDLASVSDQTDAYAVLRLEGRNARDALAKMFPIDIHPRSFVTGSVAVTTVAQAGAILCRLDDKSDGTAVFEIAVYRSLAASFWNFLTDSAAEFGLQVRAVKRPDVL